MLSISLRRASAQRVARSSANASPSGDIASRRESAAAPGLRWCARRNPGADGVDEMKLDQVARGGGRRGGCWRWRCRVAPARSSMPASGDDQSTSLPWSWTATMADTMAWPRSSDRPTRRAVDSAGFDRCHRIRQRSADGSSSARPIALPATARRDGMKRKAALAQCRAQSRRSAAPACIRRRRFCRTACPLAPRTDAARS